MVDNIPDGPYSKDRVKSLLSLISFASTPTLLQLLKESDKRASSDVYSFAPKLLIIKAIEKLSILNDHISFLQLKEYLATNDLKDLLSPREIEDKLIGYISQMEYEGLLIGTSLTPLARDILNTKKEVEHLFSTLKDTLN